jgi:cysteine desulfurase / selenocysteine lyase
MKSNVLELSKRPAVDWKAVRASFPAATNFTYLNSASRGIVSEASHDAGKRFLDIYLTGVAEEGTKPIMTAVRDRFARLIGASPDEIATTKNTSDGLNAVGSAIDWKKGDNVVLTPELEHPNNIYLWAALRDRGVEMRLVSSDDGSIDAEAVAEAIDERTRVVTASSVTFTPGYRTDLATIGKAARRHGALFLVDAVQSLGVLEMDVDACHIDALATSTSKGLLGVQGQGFLYVRASRIEELRPAYVARYSVARGTGHESEMEGMDFQYQPNAQRFEIGSYNWVSLAVVANAMKEILDIGIDRVDAHVEKLATQLADGLKALDLPVNEPPKGIRRSHIVTVGRMNDGDAYGSADQRLNQIATVLKESDVRFTIRRGLLRFGFHCYNDHRDVERVLDLVESAGK